MENTVNISLQTPQTGPLSGPLPEASTRDRTRRGSHPVPAEPLPVVRSSIPLPDGFRLAHGGALPGGRLAFEAVGHSEAPAVVVLGGISAGRHVTRNSADLSPGWWEAFVGDGQALDPHQSLVISLDYLGGHGTSAGPAEVRGCRGSIPLITPADQARALVLVLDHLGVEKLHAIIGASYGGMVALALGNLFPERVAHAVVISAAHESHPMATALRVLQRRATLLGQDVGSEAEGLELARGIAMTTYRSSGEFAQRFSSRPDWVDGQPRFPVESYLEHQGRRFSQRFRTDRFLCMSQSLDLHRVEPREVDIPTTLVAVVEDTLVPLWQMRDLHRGLPKPAGLIELSSRYGHDAFLKEADALAPVLRGAASNGEVAR